MCVCRSLIFAPENEYVIPPGMDTCRIRLSPIRRYFGWCLVSFLGEGGGSRLASVVVGIASLIGVGGAELLATV